ncbi:kinase-like protein [Clavulina sp. PMI_390]|nr:kinase-like protein [Clavulina sp. PMI_390]
MIVPPHSHHLVQLVHREAITQSQLHHPNILPFLGIYNEAPDSPPLTVVPYVAGGSLYSVLNSRNLLGADKFKSILLGIGKGVLYLHSLNPPVIHGDLHPGNVLLGGSEKPILCDFGLSRILHEVTRTRTQRLGGGMARFLAPELSHNTEERFRTTRSTDIYALSMVSFNMWTGKKPFSDMSMEWKVTLASIKGKRPTKPSDSAIYLNLHQKLEGDFWNLLLEMWTQKPSERPAIDVVLSRLRVIFDKQSLLTSAFGAHCAIM